MAFNLNRHADNPPDAAYTYNPFPAAISPQNRINNYIIQTYFETVNNRIRVENKIIHEASSAGHANTRFIPLYRFDGATLEQFPRDALAVHALDSKSAPCF